MKAVEIDNLINMDGDVLLSDKCDGMGYTVKELKAKIVTQIVGYE